MAEQKCTDLDWEDVRVFLALARHRSLSAAARALSITHATVARRMRSLEGLLGERLVERRPDGYVLTPAGSRVLVSANQMETAAAVIVRQGRTDGLSGLVRVNAPPSLCQVFLVGKMAQLARSHPGLDVDIATDFRAVSLGRGETDIALRYVRPHDGDVIARRLVKVGFGFYATRACKARVAAGVARVFVGFDEVNAALPEAVWLSQRFPRARFAVRANGQVAQAAAAKSGVGFALLPHFIGQHTQGLVSCDLEHVPPPRDIWLLTRQRDKKDNLVRTVAGFIAQSFEEERKRFEGSDDLTKRPHQRTGRCVVSD